MKKTNVFKVIFTFLIIFTFDGGNTYDSYFHSVHAKEKSKSQLEAHNFWLFKTTALNLNNAPQKPFQLIFRTKYKETTPHTIKNLPYTVVVELDGKRTLYAKHSTLGTNTTNFGVIKAKKIRVLLIKSDKLYSIKGKYQIEYR
ncbi:MAG: hypothetical protein ACRC5C_00365 [Bacilli bacterium]